jgi:hypothetical protein
MRIEGLFNSKVKGANSWEAITYAQAKEAGYSVPNVDAARLKEATELKEILKRIGELTAPSRCNTTRTR